MKYSIHQDEEELHFTDSWHSKTIVQDSHLAFFIWRNLINECAKKCKPKATPSGLLSFSVEESRKKLQTGSLTIKGTDSEYQTLPMNMDHIHIALVEAVFSKMYNNLWKFSALSI